MNYTKNFKHAWKKIGELKKKPKLTSTVINLIVLIPYSTEVTLFGLLDLTEIRNRKR